MQITALGGNEKATSEKSKELYGKVLKVADESLQESNVTTPLLQKIKKPSEHTKLIERWMLHKDVLEDAEIGKDVMTVEDKLNSVFCQKNNLPKAIQSKDDLIALCKWVEKDSGIIIDTTFMHEGEYWGRSGLRRISYKNGTSALESIINMAHEMDHMGDPFAEIAKKEEKSLFSELYPNRMLSDACQMFSEGSAIFAEMKLLRSNDAALRAYTAIYILTNIAEPSPQVMASKNKNEEARMLKSGKGFRYYYMLEQSIGEDKLKWFRAECLENSLVAGIHEGKLAAVDPDSGRMFEADLKKLKQGVMNLKELLTKELPAEFPKNLNCGLFV